MRTLIKNAKVVNENSISQWDVLIENDLICKIGKDLNSEAADLIIDGTGKFLIPGVIDDQVHFRDPGLTHKGDLESESKAAIAGGTTSFIDQPNTVPNAVTQELLEEKYQLGAEKSFANYSFSMGGTNDNLDEVLKTNPKEVAAIKLFLGSSGFSSNSMIRSFSSVFIIPNREASWIGTSITATDNEALFFL